MIYKTIDDIPSILKENPHVFKVNFHFDGKSDGYVPGVFGAKSGPDINVFDSLCHELAHGVLCYRGEKYRLLVRDYGLRIKTEIDVFGKVFYEPLTMQATITELKAVAIQFHIMEACQYPHKDESYWATILHKFMPDYIFGGKSDQERIKTRVDLLKEFYNSESRANVIDEVNQMLTWVYAELSTQIDEDASDTSSIFIAA